MLICVVTKSRSNAMNLTWTPWTRPEEAFVEAHVNEYTDAELGELLGKINPPGRTAVAVERYRQVLGITRSREGLAMLRRKRQTEAA